MIDKIKYWIFAQWAGPAVKWLDGKKTILGALQLLLALAIFVVPELYPQYAQYAEYARMAAEFLISQGIDMDAALTAGTVTTTVGLLDKVRKLFTSKSK